MTEPGRRLEVDSRIRIPFEEFEFSFARSSGPGGQNVNKVSSKAILRWPAAASPSLPPDVRDRLVARYANRITGAGDLILSSQRFRDAGRNVTDCLEKLREMLQAVSRAPKRRRPTRPSRSSVRRRLETKKRQSQKKQGRGGVSDV